MNLAERKTVQTTTQYTVLCKSLVEYLDLSWNSHTIYCIIPPFLPLLNVTSISMYTYIKTTVSHLHKKWCWTSFDYTWIQSMVPAWGWKSAGRWSSCHSFQQEWNMTTGRPWKVGSQSSDCMSQTDMVQGSREEVRGDSEGVEGAWAGCHWPVRRLQLWPKRWDNQQPCDQGRLA